MKIINKLFTVFVLLLSLAGYSQVANGGEPYLNKLLVNKSSANERAVFENFYIQNSEGQTVDLLSLSSMIEKKSLKDIDNNKLINEASQTQQNGIDLYGKILPLESNIADINKRVKINDRYFNILEVSSPDAKSLQVYFKDYNLPEGATLFVYDSEGLMVLGSFTSNNNPKEIVEGGYSFMTQPLVGNKIILELSYPVDSPSVPILNLQSVGHGFKSFYEKVDSKGTSGNCNKNIACNFGNGTSDVAKNIKSVGLILANYKSQNMTYSYSCSGALINNGKQDGTPYFLTAEHCIDVANSNPNWKNELLVLFNYEKKNCDDDGTSASWNPSNNSVLGVQLLTSSPMYFRDFALLKLKTTKEILGSYKVSYAGWDNSVAGYTNNVSNSYTVHHPSGDAKKISMIKQIDPADINYQLSYFGDYLQVIYKDGIVEHGSSGGPLFNGANKLIGLLSTGKEDLLNCDSQYKYTLGLSQFSRFSNDFLQMSQWLDPENKSIQSIGTYSPSFPIAPGPITVTYPPTSNNYVGVPVDVNNAQVHPSTTFGKKLYTKYEAQVPNIMLSSDNLISTYQKIDSNSSFKIQGIYKIVDCNKIQYINTDLIIKMKNSLNPSGSNYSGSIIGIGNDRIIIKMTESYGGNSNIEIHSYKIVDKNIVFESWFKLPTIANNQTIKYSNNHLLIYDQTSKILYSWSLENGNWLVGNTLAFTKSVFDLQIFDDKFFLSTGENKLEVYSFQQNSPNFSLVKVLNNIFKSTGPYDAYTILSITRNINQSNVFNISYKHAVFTSYTQSYNRILELNLNDYSYSHLNLGADNNYDFLINGYAYYNSYLFNDTIYQFTHTGSSSSTGVLLQTYKKTQSTGVWSQVKRIVLLQNTYFAINDKYILQHIAKTPGYNPTNVYNIREIEYLTHPVTLDYSNLYPTPIAAYNVIKDITTDSYWKDILYGRNKYTNEAILSNKFVYSYTYMSGYHDPGNQVYDNKTIILSDYTKKIPSNSDVSVYGNYSVVMKPGFSVSSSDNIEFSAIAQKDYSNEGIPPCSLTFDDMINPQLGNFSQQLYQKNSAPEMPSYGEIIYLPQEKLDENTIENRYKIYPNPTSGSIEIETTDIVANSKVSVVSMDGKLIQEKTILNKKTRIDLSSYPTGIYFLNVYSNNKLLFSRSLNR